MPVTIEEQHGNEPLMVGALKKVGITPDSLAKRIKKELKAKTKKTVFGSDGEIVRTEIVTAWDVQQRARMDAQKLLGLYPAEKLSVDANVMIEVVDRYVPDED